MKQKTVPVRKPRKEQIRAVIHVDLTQDSDGRLLDFLTSNYMLKYLHVLVPGQCLLIGLSGFQAWDNVRRLKYLNSYNHWGRSRTPRLKLRLSEKRLSFLERVYFEKMLQEKANEPLQ